MFKIAIGVALGIVLAVLILTYWEIILLAIAAMFKGCWKAIKFIFGWIWKILTYPFIVLDKKIGESITKEKMLEDLKKKKEIESKQIESNLNNLELGKHEINNFNLKKTEKTISLEEKIVILLAILGIIIFISEFISGKL